MFLSAEDSKPSRQEQAPRVAPVPVGLFSNLMRLAERYARTLGEDLIPVSPAARSMDQPNEGREIHRSISGCHSRLRYDYLIF